MELYRGTTKQFVRDVTQHTIAEKLNERFTNAYHYRVGVSELTSWQNSLMAMALQIMHTGLDDHGIILEMQLPLTSARLDCLITGRDDEARDQAVLVELKQWSTVWESDIDECVETVLARKRRTVAHPSVQARNYRQYLDDTHGAFNGSEEHVILTSCSFLHNFQFDSISPLFAPQFRDVLATTPLFTGDQPDDFARFLDTRLRKGDGSDVLRRITKSKYRASKKLLEHTAAVLAGEPRFTLLDEQIVACNAIVSYARKGFHNPTKTVVLIEGGPGTGKSLIALNAQSRLLAAGYNTQHATGSKAFTENIRKAVGQRASAQFRYFNSYMSAAANDLDVLIADEAHRIRESSNSRFTPHERRSDKAQIDEMIDAAKVSVFLIDDHQVVRPGEIGSAEVIRKAAKRHHATLIETQLETQFRCAGSDKFIDWINAVLQIGEYDQQLQWTGDEAFEFRIVDSVEELDQTIRTRSAEGYSARLAAGFCWPWSDPTDKGALVDDVVIGSFRRPWNAKGDTGKLARGIPKASYWATDSAGIDQIGCIYTAQGFEFDYVGVIIGPDLHFDDVHARWEGIKAFSFDSAVKRSKPDSFTQYVKNVYRVLLTRGLKGCYVAFLDDSARQKFESSMLQLS
ncbi:DUF2075 domain-containing protein [bacterium]|nr:MAG: DUF2075 domain-containing protein [bacterium]